MSKSIERPKTVLIDRFGRFGFGMSFGRQFRGATRPRGFGSIRGPNTFVSGPTVNGMLAVKRPSLRARTTMGVPSLDCGRPDVGVLLSSDGHTTSD